MCQVLDSLVSSVYFQNEHVKALTDVQKEAKHSTCHLYCLFT